jgi:hypothetical protein
LWYPGQLGTKWAPEDLRQPLDASWSFSFDRLNSGWANGSLGAMWENCWTKIVDRSDNGFRGGWQVEGERQRYLRAGDELLLWERW